MYVVYNSCIFAQNITNVGFQWKPCLFFLFCDLDFINFFNLLGGIHDYFGKKILKTKVVFMKCEKKNNLNHLVTRLGIRASVPALAPRFVLRSGLRSGPRAQPSQQVVSIYFYFALHETTLVSRFLAKIVVKPPRRLKKSMKPGHRKKDTVSI